MTRSNTDTGSSLVAVGPLRAALAEAVADGDFPKLRDVHALGVAFQKGAKVRGMGIDAENEAAEIVLRAERAMGLLLRAMAESGLRAGSGPHAGPNTPSLAEITGLTNQGKTVQGWRDLAKLSDEDFEAEITTAREHERRLARVNFIRKQAGPSDSALKVGSPVNEGLDLVRKGTYALVGWGVDDDGDGFAFADKATIQYLATDELVELADLIRMLAAAYTAEKTRR